MSSRQLHLFPQRIPEEVEKAFYKHKDKYSSTFVVYADCGTGGLLKTKCEELGIEMIAGPHCYSFFEGNKKFAESAESEITAFYLTDFLVRQFDSFVWKPLGLDRHPELLEIYFGNYTKLVYMAQTDDRFLDEKAGECARRLDLEYERRLRVMVI